MKSNVKNAIKNYLGVVLEEYGKTLSHSYWV